MKTKQLTPFAQARETVLNALAPLPMQRMPLERAFGFILRADIRADRPLPPFNRAAMDGYAVRFSDLQKGIRRFKCIGVLEAGRGWDRPVPAGCCLKIMTGAPVPPPLDAVEQVEKSRAGGEWVELSTVTPSRWQHVHRAGADAKKGSALVKRGEPLTPPRIAVAAAVGAARVEVTRPVRVAVIATGKELVSVSSTPKPWQIRDSNSRFLLARLGGIPWVVPAFHGVVRDDPKELTRILKGAVAASDMVLITGGVSMGDRDHTPEVLAACGVKNRLYKCAIRPGKPVWFGVKAKTAVFGLPGNPVSVAVTFHQFVLPALRAMSGQRALPPTAIHLPLASAAKKKHELREFRVAQLVNGGAAVRVVASYQGSGDFASTAHSDGVIVIPERTRELPAGTIVEFQPWAC